MSDFLASVVNGAIGIKQPISKQIQKTVDKNENLFEQTKRKRR